MHRQCAALGVALIAMTFDIIRGFRFRRRHQRSFAGDTGFDRRPQLRLVAQRSITLSYLRCGLFRRLVEGMLKFTVGMPDCQDRDCRLLYDAFGDAAHQHVGKARAAVSANDDQVGVFGLTGVENFEKRRTDPEQAPGLEAVVAQTLYDLVELALCDHALLFRDPAHRADVHRGAEVRRNHHRSEGLIDMHHDDLGAELAPNIFGIAQGQRRVF